MNERLDLPSASSIERVHFCPASHKMELAAQKIAPEKSDAAANSGSLTHGLIAGDEADADAPYNNVVTADMCEDQCQRILGEWRGPDSEGDVTMIEEKRLWLTYHGDVIDEPHYDVIFSGKFDRLYIQGNRGLLLDWKTLNGDHAPAIENRQLAAYAVLVMRYHWIDSLRVALVQPWKGRPTVCEYDPVSYSLAYNLLMRDLDMEQSSTPDDRKAGKWCHHCKARFGCEVFKAQAIQEVERVQPMNIAGLAPKEQGQAMFARAMDFTPAQHIGAYRGLQMVKRYVHAIEASFKARVEAGQIPGYAIESKPGNREITDAQKAWHALIPLGVTAEDVIAACSLPVGALEEAVRKASGIKSKTANRTTYNLTTEQAKNAVNTALESAGAMGRKADVQRIIEVKEDV